MAQKRPPIRKVTKIQASNFDGDRSARVIANDCDVARRSAGRALDRVAASGLSRRAAVEVNDAVLETALRAQPSDDVDWAKVEKERYILRF